MAEATKNQTIAKEIISQLGGMNRLVAMTGAYNFIAVENGLSFRVRSPKGANYFKIVLTPMDVYNVYAGRIRGEKLTEIATGQGYYSDMLKDFVETNSGLYLSFAKGGTVPGAKKRAEKAEKKSAYKAEIKRLTGMNQSELADEYEHKYGLPGRHHDYNTLVAALYYNKRIKHLTEKEIATAKKFEKGGEINQPSEADMRAMYKNAFGLEYDDPKRGQAPLPLHIAYEVAKQSLQNGRKIPFDKFKSNAINWSDKRNYGRGVGLMYNPYIKYGPNSEDLVSLGSHEVPTEEKNDAVGRERIYSQLYRKYLQENSFYETGGRVYAKDQDTLTKGNVEPGLRIASKENPEWGDFAVLRKYHEGIWEIRGRSGDRVLNEDEFHHWIVVKSIPYRDGGFVSAERQEFESAPEKRESGRFVIVKNLTGNDGSFKSFYEGGMPFYITNKNGDVLYKADSKADALFWTGNRMEDGGHIGFKKLSSQVAKKYEGQPVAKKYQKEYGKTYDKAEAREVGDKVAGTVSRIKRGLAKGGTIPAPNAQRAAKRIAASLAAKKGR